MRERERDKERERLLNISLITRKKIIGNFCLLLFFLHYSLRNFLDLISFTDKKSNRTSSFIGH